MLCVGYTSHAQHIPHIHTTCAHVHTLTCNAHTHAHAHTCTRTHTHAHTCTLTHHTHTWHSRLMSLIRSTRGNVVFGGDTDEQKLKINPTLITDVTPGDPIMEDEIFGPILPFVPVDSVDEAINLVNSRYEV